jgi:outer membrane receptor protein involved in Fe transport
MFVRICNLKKYVCFTPSLIAIATCVSFSGVAESLKLDNSDIETVTVTATRSHNELLSLSSNLYSLDKSTLELLDHEHINQAVARVPGGWISRGNGQEHLTAIRSPVLTGAGGCGAFYMAQDGVSIRAPGFCNTNQLFDVNSEQAQRIEVLRGPASTMYGSNAVHGVINVITPDPINSTDSSIGIRLGPHDYMRGNFSLTSSTAQQGLMIYGNATHDGGYKDNSGFDQQKINAIHQYQTDKLSIKNVIAFTNLNQDTAGFIKGFESYKDDKLAQENPNPEAYRNSQSFRAYSHVNYALDNSAMLSVTPYIRWANMEFLQHYLPWQPVENNKQSGFGVKSQYEKKADQLTWLFGLDVDATQGSLVEAQTLSFSPTIPSGEHYNYDVDANVYSPFATVMWTPLSNVKLNVGVRYEYTGYDYQNNLAAGGACEPAVVNCRFTRPENQKISYQNASYQMGGSYLFSENKTMFAQYSTGYRAPQATELFRLQAGQTVADLEAEEIDSLELGLRGQWQSLFYDVSVFSMQKNNFIFQDTDRQNISNGKTKHTGIEFSLRYSLPNNLYLNATGTIANHQYDAALTLSKTNIQHNEIDTAPQHMGTMQFGWNDKNGKQIELEWVHLGNYYVNPENTAEYAGHNILNLRSTIALTPALSISASLLNVVDENYAERADFGFGSYRYFVGEPRSIYLSSKYTF